MNSLRHVNILVPTSVYTEGMSFNIYDIDEYMPGRGSHQCVYANECGKYFNHVWEGEINIFQRHRMINNLMLMSDTYSGGN